MTNELSQSLNDLKLQDKQRKGLKRNTIDKYYTKTEVVDNCIRDINKYLQVDKNDLVIEPSAGNGAFINGIKKLTNNFKFYDLEPEHEEIIQQDYLEYNPDSHNLKSKTHIIGNPPFGRQSSLAIKFIKKSCKFSNSVSFILPKSFKKDSLQKHFPPNFHLVFETDLPDRSFLVDGNEHDVPCIFQIWTKKQFNRPPIEKLEPRGFTFVKINEDPHISFRRVGVNAGAIDTQVQNKSIQSHYFIKFTQYKNVDDSVKKLNTITYDNNNTVGPKSISKQELIKQFNDVL